VIADFASLQVWVLLLLFAGGLAGLYYGGNWLTDGATGLALALRVNPMVIGLTIVSMATSAPELFTSMISAARGSPGIAVGNIVGSNIANIGLILGVAAVIWPFRVENRLLQIETPLLLGLSVVFTAVCFGVGIGRVEGFVLVAVLAVYLYLLVAYARRGRVEGAAELVAEEISEIEQKRMSLRACVAYVAVGALALALGSDLLVGASVEMAHRLGVSDVLIGVTIVAVGTSLPELAATISAATRRHTGIVVGNIIGSNLFNMLFIGGTVSLVFGLPVDRRILFFELPAMLAGTALMWFFLATGRKLVRTEGVVLLLLYALIIAVASLRDFGIIQMPF